jgi:hypothetical protein
MNIGQPPTAAGAMVYIDDKDVWATCPVDYLWIYDKLILARKNGYSAGPAGIPVPRPGWYIVRPITNIRMMSRGATKQWLTPADTDSVPDGYFWTEWFDGRHTSVDFHHGIQQLAVEGFRSSDRLDRFCRWERISDQHKFPQVLEDLWQLMPWVNVEYVDGKIIEVHLRWNDDFANHTGDVIYPVWKDDPGPQPPGSIWYPSIGGDRLGFWVENK